MAKVDATIKIRLKSVVLNSAFLVQIMPGRISLEMMFSRTSYRLSPTQQGYCFSCDDSSYQPPCRCLTFPTITTNENTFSEPTICQNIQTKFQKTLWKLLAAQEFSQIVVKKKTRIRLYVIRFLPWRLFYLLLLVHKDRNKLRNDSKCMGWSGVRRSQLAPPSGCISQDGVEIEGSTCRWYRL